MTREGIKTEKPKLESGIFVTEVIYIDKNDCSLWVERDRSLTKLFLLVNTVISMALASMGSIPSAFLFKRLSTCIVLKEDVDTSKKI